MPPSNSPRSSSATPAAADRCRRGGARVWTRRHRVRRSTSIARESLPPLRSLRHCAVDGRPRMCRPEHAAYRSRLYRVRQPERQAGAGTDDADHAVLLLRQRHVDRLYLDDPVVPASGSMHKFAGTAQYERLFATPRWQVAYGNMFACSERWILSARSVSVSCWRSCLIGRVRFEGIFPNNPAVHPAVDLCFIVTGTDLAMGAQSPRSGHVNIWYATLAGRTSCSTGSPNRTAAAFTHSGVCGNLAPVRADHGHHAGRATRRRPGNLARGADRGHPDLAHLCQYRPADTAPACGDLRRVDRDMPSSKQLRPLVVAMTNGGPGFSSDLPGKFVVDFEFERANIGQASAAATVMLGSVLAIVSPLSLLRAGAERRSMTTSRRNARIGRIGLYLLLVWILPVLLSPAFGGDLYLAQIVR